jgi:Tfp pilus assembly protein PilF
MVLCAAPRASHAADYSRSIRRRGIVLTGCRLALRRTALAAGLLIWATASQAAAPGTAEYLRGLTALQQQRAADAVLAFTAAIEADEESADYHTARGVACLMSEDLSRGIKDLERSLRLRPNHTDSRMWLAAAVGMTGDFGRDATIYPFATNDPYESFVRQASHDYGELAFRQSMGQAGQRERQMRAAALPRLAQGAAEFATRAKANPDLAAEVLARAIGLAAAGDFAAAWPELETALAGRPDDAELLYQHGRCALELGDLATAREELTRALTLRTDHGPSYVVRALTAARLGDALRARDDLLRAQRLSPAEAAAAKPGIDQALAALPANPAASSVLFAALEQSARDNAPWTDLVEQAVELRQAVNGRRRQHDEWYQDRLRALEDAVREQPRNANRLAALGRFLYDQASVGRERVEPRGPYRLFRRQTTETQAQEIARADKLADHALAIDPRNVRAMAVKASVGTWNGLYADAETIVREGLKLQPNSTELLELLAELLEVAAAQKSAEAANLRSPKYVGSSSETVVDYIYTYTYYHHPTMEEKAAADALDSEAQQCVDLALEQIARAAKTRAGTAEGFYFQGVYHWKQGELDKAAVSYEQALRLDPQQVRWRTNLAGIYAALGRFQDAMEQRITATRRIESSAAPLLELTWDHIAHTKWKSARETLRRAIELDASDARVPAYLGVVAAANDQPEEARVWFQTALALEEARLRLAGKSLDAVLPLPPGENQGEGPGEVGGEPLDDAAASEAELAALGPLGPADYGLSMAIRLRLGRMLLTLDQPEQAAEVFLGAMQLEPRVRRQDYPVEIPSAMLPDPSMEAHVVPEADTVLALSAWWRSGAGEALNRLKRYQETVRIVAPVLTFQEMLINGYGGDRLRKPEVYASLHLARAYLEMGDLERAQQYVGRVPKKRFGSGPSLDPNAELEEVGTALHEEIAAARQGRRRVGDETSDEWQPPDEETVNAALRQLGPQMGHPEMGDGSMRFSGDGQEVALCRQVDQAVRWIVGPKSTRWRTEIVTGLTTLGRSSEAYERYLDQSRARLERRRQIGGAGRRAAEQELADLDARAGRVEIAVRLLTALAIERGYPKAALENDLAEAR